ncbi:MAG TPA: hypothetical protein VNH18_22670, partial [Bryobacteraceae bacterium]|nr:hypothetical protein [Bryobacteraceae bacterium]
PGAIGPQGIQGIQGVTGATGAAGTAGAQGLPGLTCAAGMCVYNLAIGAQGNHIAQGTVFPVSFDWYAWGTGAYCPTCVEQYYVGLSPEAISGTAPIGAAGQAACFISTVFNGTVQSGRASFNLTAPAAIGVYRVALDGVTLNFGCPNSPGGLPNGVPTPDRYLGFITVF